MKVEASEFSDTKPSKEGWWWWELDAKSNILVKVFLDADGELRVDTKHLRTKPKVSGCSGRWAPLAPKMSSLVQ